MPAKQFKEEFPYICRHTHTQGSAGAERSEIRDYSKRRKYLFLFPSLFLSKKDKIDTYPISLLQRNICLVKFVLKMWANISAKKLL